MKTDITITKCINLSVCVIKLCREIQWTKKEYILTKQIVRSSTSIGANFIESRGAESPADFIHKLSIARKELLETEYWLILMKETELMPAEKFLILENQLSELNRIISSIILTCKGKLKRE